MTTEQKSDRAGTVDAAPGEARSYQAGTLVYTKPALAVLFFWLLWGDFCFTLMEGVVPDIMKLRFKAMDAPNWAVGMILMTIPSILSTGLGPVVSFRSDRCRSRWGRRIPFIFFTMPFLVACLIGLACSGQISPWVHARFGALLGGLSAPTVALVVTGTFMTLFAFFNVFVNSVFWYLFNDVVPEHLLARFMSWFRVVGLASGSLYNLFIFEHAGTHATEILLGAAVLYFVGFGLMCLNVKEGQYPPPPAYVAGEVGVIAAGKTFVRECSGLAHYWYLFMASVGMAGVYAAFMFWLYLNQTIGLDLRMIGQLNFIGSIAGAASILISGWLADRYHPLRVVLVGLVLQVVVGVPTSSIWLFWHPSPQVTFWVCAAMSVLVSAPISAFVGVYDPPLLMRIFPRERYGQFCSANAMCRSLAGILAGTLVGIYLDILTRRWGEGVAYRCLPLWFMGAYGLMLFFMFKLYRSWQRYGGDESYVPPLPESRGLAGLAAETAGAAVGAGSRSVSED